MVVDERMSTRDVMTQLIEKNHFDFSPNWTLVEEMPSLFLGIYHFFIFFFATYVFIELHALWKIT